MAQKSDIVLQREQVTQGADMRIRGYEADMRIRTGQSPDTVLFFEEEKYSNLPQSEEAKFSHLEMCFLVPPRRPQRT